jgi:hypothetical protein
MQRHVATPVPPPVNTQAAPIASCPHGPPAGPPAPSQSPLRGPHPGPGPDATASRRRRAGGTAVKTAESPRTTVPSLFLSRALAALGQPPPSPNRPSKIEPWHLERLAVVYVRQAAMTIRIPFTRGKRQVVQGARSPRSASLGSVETPEPQDRRKSLVPLRYFEFFADPTPFMRQGLSRYLAKG